MSETSQEKAAAGEHAAVAAEKHDPPKPVATQEEQKNSQLGEGKMPETATQAILERNVSEGESNKPALIETTVKSDLPIALPPPSTIPGEKETPAPLATMQVAPTTSAIADQGQKVDSPQAAMLASLKQSKEELSSARAVPEETPKKMQPVAKGKELKCKTCALCKDERIPVAIFQHMEGNIAVAIKFSPLCGHGCTIVINNAFEIMEHVCTSYQEKQDSSDTKLNLSDFDFDKFISGSEDLDDFLLKQRTKQASKLVSLEDQMKVAVKKLVKPLAVLVPTAVQKKSEAQLRAEREDRLRQIVETEANLIYLRVLEFEKAATGNTSYQIDKLGKMLKDLDKRYITGFIQKVNNDFLISFNEQTQTVRFYNPSRPEVEILSREFEKWLRFNRL